MLKVVHNHYVKFDLKNCAGIILKPLTSELTLVKDQDSCNTHEYMLKLKSPN